MKNERIKSFKENLKRMLMLYALVPALELMALCIAIFLCIGGLFVVTKNRRTNEEVTGVVEHTISAYEELLKELSETQGIIDRHTSSTKRQVIMRRLYSSAVDTGYAADLYILDKDYNLCVSTWEEMPEEFAGELRKMQRVLFEAADRPDKTAVYVKPLGNDRKIYLARAVEGRRGIEGYVAVGLSYREFMVLLSSYSQKNIMVDETGWAFAASSYSLVDEVGRLDRELREKRGFFSYGGDCYYAATDSLRDGKIWIYTFTEITDLIQILASMAATGFGVLIFVCLVTFFRAEKMAVKSTADIRSMNEAFQSVMEGRLESYLDLHSSTEFQNIGKCYNEMLDSLKRQIAANKELAETVAEVRVKQLESQFNSHFLFNTLDNIRFMCKIDTDLAELMTVSLSGLLRYNTSDANETVSVEEDLRYIGMYLEIIKVRFQDRFDYSIEVEEEVGGCPIPKLLIQPLIENSIKYGFGDREHLTVWVRVFKEEERLVFLCRDDGVGMSLELLEKLKHNLTLPKNESAHLGLYNVHRRIQLIYGEEYGIRLESHKGVNISVSLPLKGAREEKV